MVRKLVYMALGAVCLVAALGACYNLYNLWNGTTYVAINNTYTVRLQQTDYGLEVTCNRGYPYSIEYGNNIKLFCGEMGSGSPIQH